MKKEIIEKINNHIFGGLNKESDVVYLFIQIGKVIEGDNSHEEYPTLWFYRCWVAHRRMGYGTGRKYINKGTRKVLDQLEAMAYDYKCGNTPKKSTDIISLKKLTSELELFFNNQIDFNQKIIEKFNSFDNLGGLILSILSDLPLIATPEYKFIDEFSFKFIADKNIVFPKIKLKTGEVLEL